MTVENFIRIVLTVTEKIEKSPKLIVFRHFWANFGCFSHHTHTIVVPLPLRSQEHLWV